MGKAIMGLVLIISIEFMLFIFTGSGDQSNSLFQLILNPTNVGFHSFGIGGDAGTNTFLTNLQALFAIAIGIGVIVGLFFTVKPDTLIFMAIAGMLATFLVSIIKLWQFIYSNLGTSSYARIIVPSLITGPLIIYWLMISLDFSRGRD